MIKVSQVTEEIVRSSDFALLGIQNKLLNLSAYAEFILPNIQRRLKKPVQLGSVVVALSRLQVRLIKEKSIQMPEIIVENMSVMSGLVEVVFTKDPFIQKPLQELYKRYSDFSKYITVSHGVHEVSIIVPEIKCKLLLSLFKGYKPVVRIDDLASITLQVSPKYTHTKNTFYVLLKKLVPKSINIVEIITTSTEICLVVAEEDWEEVFALLHKNLKQVSGG